MYRQSVYDNQLSDITMKTLDNIIEGLNPKSNFEVQITRFCCILLGQIKEMSSTSNDSKVENDVGPQIETEDESDVNANPEIPMNSGDEQTDLSKNVDVYRSDGNKIKTEQAQDKGFHCDTCKYKINILN